MPQLTHQHSKFSCEFSRKNTSVCDGNVLCVERKYGYDKRESEMSPSLAWPQEHHGRVTGAERRPSSVDPRLLAPLLWPSLSARCCVDLTYIEGHSQRRHTAENVKEITVFFNLFLTVTPLYHSALNVSAQINNRFHFSYRDWISAFSSSGQGNYWWNFPHN